MKITIKLLSDLCTASGETHNSMVDTDIVYDEYGIPYIPAKRIKGCIRECYYFHFFWLQIHSCFLPDILQSP
mgnify:CR=1 FL=1